jgi:monomeric sarcosine oxidase
MNFDAIVIGAGAMGSAAAYHLARKGHKTLLLEQFSLDHQFGSSYGHSRIIRYAYDHPAYIEMARLVFPMWGELESESGEDLLQTTGGLDAGRLDWPHFVATRDSMRQMNISFEELSPADVSRHFPQFRLDEDMIGLFQPDAGLVRPSRTVKTLVQLAKKHGADFVDDCPVTRIDTVQSGVTVHTANDTHQAERLVVCAGSWAKTLLESVGLNLPLQATRNQLLFFDAGDVAYDVPQMPIYIFWDEFTYYGIGGTDGTGFKCAQHKIDMPVLPDAVDRSHNPAYEARVREFLKRHIPAMAERPMTESRVCLYTMTPDEHFVIDRHPEYAHIAIGAGFSGHGFKFSPLIGQMLAQLVCGEVVTGDVSLFRADRFG